ncbi:hypothetical protein NDU88_011429 [Pleurodeles waltl]|uniref:Uncharacterized protein n=1 Tax=Pleurodeles waltl TaxID=8319 RepID=A0AAV7Q0M0_PLEWA|nr:hypothetical protein NDU88_011429 [Pleurodeles waltl]
MLQGPTRSALPQPLAPPLPKSGSGRPQRIPGVPGVPGCPGPRPHILAAGFRGRPVDDPLTPASSGGTGLRAPVVLSSPDLFGALVSPLLLLAELRSGKAACACPAAPGPLTGSEFLRLFGYGPRQEEGLLGYFRSCLKIL